MEAGGETDNNVCSVLPTLCCCLVWSSSVVQIERETVPARGVLFRVLVRVPWHAAYSPAPPTGASTAAVL